MTDPLDRAVAPPAAAFYVLTLDQLPTDEGLARLKAMWREEMGEVPLVLLGPGVTLSADPHAQALALLRELVAARDAGSDTYDVSDIVEKARSLLGIPKPW